MFSKYFVSLCLPVTQFIIWNTRQNVAIWGYFSYQCEVDVAHGLERTGHKYSLHLNRGLLVLRYILMDSEVCVYVDIHWPTHCGIPLPWIFTEQVRVKTQKAEFSTYFLGDGVRKDNLEGALEFLYKIPECLSECWPATWIFSYFIQSL